MVVAAIVFDAATWPIAAKVVYPDARVSFFLARLHCVANAPTSLVVLKTAPVLQLIFLLSAGRAALAHVQGDDNGI